MNIAARCFLAGFILQGCCPSIAEGVDEGGSSLLPETVCMMRCGRAGSGGELDCSDLELESVPDWRTGPCRHANGVPNLEGNRHQTLYRDDMTGFAKLRTLVLQNNKIQNIDAGAFKDLTSLESLHMQMNNLAILNPGVFDGLEKVSDRVILNENRIGRITPGVFETLTSLTLLAIESNRIAKIDPGSFKNMSRLRYLYLAENLLERIEGGTFAGLNSLEILDLSNNKIQTIDADGFKGLTSLLILRLNANVIGNVMTVTGLPSLHQLDLRANDINTITNNDFLMDKLGEQNFEISIESNPLTCDCFLETVRQWYIIGNRTDQPVCRQPTEYSNILLATIDTPFQCDSTTTGRRLAMSSNPNQYHPSSNQVHIIIIIVAVGLLVLMSCIIIKVYRYSKREGPDENIYVNGYIEKDHIENGHIENGHIENGHIENGHIKNGHIEKSPVAPMRPPPSANDIQREHKFESITRLPPNPSEESSGGITHQVSPPIPQPRGEDTDYAQPMIRTSTPTNRSTRRHPSLNPDPVCTIYSDGNGRIRELRPVDSEGGGEVGRHVFRNSSSSGKPLHGISDNPSLAYVALPLV